MHHLIPLRTLVDEIKDLLITQDLHCCTDSKVFVDSHGALILAMTSQMTS